MKIITTPMCEDIVRLAGISDYVVNKNPDEEEGDLAIVLSESKVEMDSLSIKINTPSQIFKSIREVSRLTGNELGDEVITSFFKDHKLCCKYLDSHFKRDVNVKVYSNFLKDIVLDLGFNIVSENFDYVIYPDYLKDNVIETENLVEIPSHNGISKNPFEKVELRYSILENLI
jgi:segregation and condensation protein B